jgi:hypothetical protein
MRVRAVAAAPAAAVLARASCLDPCVMHVQHREGVPHRREEAAPRKDGGVWAAVASRLQAREGRGGGEAGGHREHRVGRLQQCA